MTKAIAGQSGETDEEKVERILESAFTEFSLHGFDGAQEGAIARQAGVSTATLKRYFPQKAELFREAVRSAIVRTVEDLGPAELVIGKQDPAGKIREFAQWFWRTMDQPSQSALLRLSACELHRFPELAVFHTIEVLGRSAQKLERILIDCNRRGELDVSDPRVTSRVVLSALVTHAHWFAQPAVYSGLTGVDRERAQTAVIEVLLEIVRPGNSDPGSAEDVLNGMARDPAATRHSSPDISP